MKGKSVSDGNFPCALEDDAFDNVAAGTMRNDLSNGRPIAGIGVAVTKPAEFVIFRIGQKTTGSSG